MADTLVGMRAAVVAFCTLAAAAAVDAQSLSDPTRPPDAVANPGSAESAGAPENGLQSIIRSNQGKPGAIINGEYVLLGGRIGDARLVKIGEDSVTLKSSAGTEILTLVPGVEKTPSNGGQRRKDKVHKDRNEEKK